MTCYFHDKLVQCSGGSFSLVEKEHDIWDEYDHRNHRSEMSKSAFYASKESLRKTRERELKELIELREFRDSVVDMSNSDRSDFEILIDIVNYAQRLQDEYASLA